MLRESTRKSCKPFLFLTMTFDPTVYNQSHTSWLGSCLAYQQRILGFEGHVKRIRRQNLSKLNTPPLKQPKLVAKLPISPKKCSRKSWSHESSSSTRCAARLCTSRWRRLSGPCVLHRVRREGCFQTLAARPFSEDGGDRQAGSG